MDNYDRKQIKHMKKKDRLFMLSSLLTLLIGVFFMVLYILDFFYPKTNLRIINVTVNGNEHSAHGHFIRGENISFRVSICKITDVPVELGVEFFDGDKDNIPFVTKVSYTEKGCPNLILASILPTNAPIGNYNIKITAHQVVNSRRVIHQEFIIPNIKIVDADHK